MFGKYYRNERITYWFFSFLPWILLLQLWGYMAVAQADNPEAWEFLNYFFLPLAGGAGAILILVQSLSHLLFAFRLRKLSKEQRAGVKQAAATGFKMGKLLKTDDVLIYYGMFSKQVLWMCDIVDWYPNSGTYQNYVPRGGRVVLHYDTINVRMKSGKVKNLNCSMQCFGGQEGELPWNTTIMVFLLGVAYLLFALYPRLMDVIAGEDMIRRLLFHTGYDVFFWVVCVVMIVLLGILLYYLKYRYVETNYDMRNAGQFVIRFLVVVVLFLFIMLRQKNDESDIARADLKAYDQGIYAQMEGVGDELTEIYHNNNGFGLLAHIDKLGISAVWWSADWYEKSLVILEGSGVEMPKQGKDYRIYYLENTRIVVKIEE